MLSKPTVEETINSRFLQGRPVEELSLSQEEAFLERMKKAQKRLIYDRHYLDMDAETRARADMVIDGTYHGQKIPAH